MLDTSTKGAVPRYFGKGMTADMLGGYLACVEGLRELLKVCTLQLARYHS